jgi:hypothetical protein
MNKFCYWSVATGNHAKMMATLIASARRAGVTEDFHVWSDQNIEGAIIHPAFNIDYERYIFKFEFLKSEVSKLDYEYFVFIDADNYFLRKPDDFIRILRNNKWFVQLESEMTNQFVKRDDWWGCPSRLFPVLLKYLGVKSERVWNTNAGFFIVRKEAIEEFYTKTIEFYTYCRNKLHLLNFTEEPALAFVGHFVDNPEFNTIGATHATWACDWTGVFKNRLPDGNSWQFEDYMSGEKRNNINPAIVHAMRSKDVMIEIAEKAKTTSPLI